MFEEISEADSLFSDTSLFGRLFGQLDKKIETIFNCDMPDNMDGYEAFAFLRQYKNKLLGDSADQIKLATGYRRIGNKIEPLNIMSYSNDKETIIQVYSLSLGKIRFSSFQEYSAFMSSLDLIT